MDVSELLESVRHETVAHVRREWDSTGPDVELTAPIDVLAEPNLVIRFDRSGWVRQMDTNLLLELIPDGGLMRVDTYAGRYAIEGTPFCTIFPVPESDIELRSAVIAAVSIGATRTMQQDASYGLRQLVDVALKALSPGIDDPTTAQDAIFHGAAVLRELLVKDPPPRRVVGQRGQRLLFPQAPDHDELVRLAFDETRRAAAGQPTVCIYLLEALDLLNEAVRAQGRPQRGLALVEQARLVVAGCEAVDLIPSDHAMVRDAYAHRFARA
jgi:uncharacterized membrane protein